MIRKSMMSAVEIDITFQNDAWEEELEPLARDAVFNTLSAVDFKGPSEVSIVFADNDFIQVLNKNYRDKDKPTNVLSFPQEEPEMLGDIILAYETVEREAREQSKSFNDHTLHLIVHGALHLLGHDHIEEKEAETMEALEIRVLEDMGIKNPYETGEFVA